MKKFLLFLVGFLAGAAYIALSFGGAFQLVFWSAGKGLGAKDALIDFASACLLIIVGFYILSWVFSKKLHCGKHAFPIGSFLMGDGMLAAVLLMRVLNEEHLKAVSGNNEALAGVYAYLVTVMVVGITFLVVSWMVSILFAQFKKFRAMSEMMDAQKKQNQAPGAEPLQQPFVAQPVMVQGADGKMYMQPVMIPVQGADGKIYMQAVVPQGQDGQGVVGQPMMVQGADGQMYMQPVVMQGQGVVLQSQPEAPIGESASPPAEDTPYAQTVEDSPSEDSSEVQEPEQAQGEQPSPSEEAGATPAQESPAQETEDVPEETPLTAAEAEPLQGEPLASSEEAGATPAQESFAQETEDVPEETPLTAAEAEPLQGEQEIPLEQTQPDEATKSASPEAVDTPITDDAQEAEQAPFEQREE